jgi:hypothetical protein
VGIEVVDHRLHHVCAGELYRVFQARFHPFGVIDNDRAAVVHLDNQVISQILNHFLGMFNLLP